MLRYCNSICKSRCQLYNDVCVVYNPTWLIRGRRPFDCGVITEMLPSYSESLLDIIFFAVEFWEVDYFLFMCVLFGIVYIINNEIGILCFMHMFVVNDIPTSSLINQSLLGC